MTVSEVIQLHKLEVYQGVQTRTRLTIRRKFILEDSLHRLRNGANLSNPLKIVFVGEAGVDDGGPLREFLYGVITAVFRSEKYFCGPDLNRVPRHNVVELSKNSFYFIGALVALSLINGGPAPGCFTDAVADYFAYGIKKVSACVMDIPDIEIRRNVNKV